jgi:hypothetical protein
MVNDQGAISSWGQHVKKGEQFQQIRCEKY